MLPAGGRQHRGCIIPQAVNTQSSAPEDGRNHRPKRVELIGIINKPLLLHLVGVYIITVGIVAHLIQLPHLCHNFSLHSTHSTSQMLTFRDFLGFPSGVLYRIVIGKI